MSVEDETETFTESTCDCDFCKSTHHAIKEWDGFVPETKLQRGMMNVIAKIEKRVRREQDKKKHT